MKELHMICNAHLDPVWQWDWEEGIAQAIGTFYSAAELADEYDYVFCHNEAILYEYIETNSRTCKSWEVAYHGWLVLST